MGEYDAIVVGAGPAGCGAALALGRSGMKPLLIEKFNCLGGAWTTGFMNPLFDCEVKAGIVRELVDDLRARGAVRRLLLRSCSCGNDGLDWRR